MTKSIADLYNEVQNIANGNRRLDLAGQWEHAATPGNIAFDATNNDYMRNVEESQLKQQENRAQYIKNNYKKEVAVAAPVPGPAPIPTMKEPKMVTTPSDKKPMSMKEALEQVRNNVQEGEAWDATRRGAAAALRLDGSGVSKAASDWATATKNNVANGAETLAKVIEPKPAAAAPAPKPIASTPTAPVGNAQTPAMAKAPMPSSLNTPAKTTGPAVAQDKKPATVTSSRSSINDIAKANNIKDVNKIRAGNTIKVGGKDYTIKKGDTLTSISRNSGSSTAAAPKTKPAPKPSTTNAVAQDKKPAFKTAPLPPRKPEQGPPIPKPNVAPSQGTSAAGGNPTPTGGYSMDRQHRNTTPNQNRSTNVAPPSGGSVPAQSSTSSTAMSRPEITDSKSQQNFLKNNLRKEEKTMSNSLIDSFLALQETKHSNMFEAAKKKHTAQASKYNNGDKDPLDDDGGKNGEVANSQAPGAVAENAQIPGHRRLSMFDPTQGYARTAGSADGAKERLEALWGAVTGEQTVHREAGLADAIRADLAAIKEEFGDMFDEEIEAISEALENIAEAPTKKDHSLAAMAAAAISKGHPVKKLPAGRAENAVLPKGMYGGGINHESGVKRQAKMRSEDVEFSAEELAHIQSVLEGNPVSGASVEGPSSSSQAAKGLQVDKGVLTDSKKKL